MTLARSPYAGLQRRRAWLSLVLLCMLSTAGCISRRPPGGGATDTPAPIAPPAGSSVPTAVPGITAPGVVPQAGGQTGPALLLGTLQMFSSAEGWATGWTAVGPRNGGVLRTGDGGYEWRNVSPPGIDPTSVETAYFLDAAHGWIVSSTRAGATSRPVPTTLTILGTADGGATWRRSASLTMPSGGPGWLSFVDAQHGWFMANLGQTAGSMAVAIYRTTDGGLNWDSVSVTTGDPTHSTKGSLPLTCNKTGISFTSLTTGWATGHCTTGGIFFWITRDAGLTWQSQSIRPPADLPANLFVTCDCETVPPVFASGQNGVVPIKIFTSKHEAVLYATQDGGNTWNATSLASAALLRQPDFVSATDGWITDETRIFRTRDGGRNWSPEVRLPDLRLLGTLDFVDLRNGWATGGQQTYRTADGGQTWTVFTPVLAPAGGAEATPIR